MVVLRWAWLATAKLRMSRGLVNETTHGHTSRTLGTKELRKLGGWSRTPARRGNAARRSRRHGTEHPVQPPATVVRLRGGTVCGSVVRLRGGTVCGSVVRLRGGTVCGSVVRLRAEAAWCHYLGLRPNAVRAEVEVNTGSSHTRPVSRPGREAGSADVVYAARAKADDGDLRTRRPRACDRNRRKNKENCSLGIWPRVWKLLGRWLDTCVGLDRAAPQPRRWSRSALAKLSRRAHVGPDASRVPAIVNFDHGEAGLLVDPAGPP
ncbi:unnamed protein product [Lampetra fluviatilis]